MNCNEFLNKEIDLLYELPSIHEGTSGVYFLFMWWVLVYVGQSKALGNRMNYHIRDKRYARGIPWTFYGAMKVPEKWLDRVEYHYIQKFKPRFNKQMAPRSV